MMKKPLPDNKNPLNPKRDWLLKNGKTDGIDGKNVNFEAGDRRSTKFYLKKSF